MCSGPSGSSRPFETAILYEHPGPSPVSSTGRSSTAPWPDRPPDRGARIEPRVRVDDVAVGPTGRGLGPRRRRAARRGTPRRSSSWPRASTSPCRRSSASRSPATSCKGPRSNAPSRARTHHPLLRAGRGRAGRLRLVGPAGRGPGPDRPADPEDLPGLPRRLLDTQLRRRPRRVRGVRRSGRSLSPRVSWPGPRRPRPGRRRGGGADQDDDRRRHQLRTGLRRLGRRRPARVLRPVVLRPGRPPRLRSAAGRPCSRRRSWSASTPGGCAPA